VNMMWGLIAAAVTTEENVWHGSDTYQEEMELNEAELGPYLPAVGLAGPTNEWCFLMESDVRPYDGFNDPTAEETVLLAEINKYMDTVNLWNDNANENIRAALRQRLLSRLGSPRTQAFAKMKSFLGDDIQSRQNTIMRMVVGLRSVCSSRWSAFVAREKSLRILRLSLAEATAEVNTSLESIRKHGYLTITSDRAMEHLQHYFFHPDGAGSGIENLRSFLSSRDSDRVVQSSIVSKILENIGYDLFLVVLFSIECNQKFSMCFSGAFTTRRGAMRALLCYVLTIGLIRVGSSGEILQATGGDAYGNNESNAGERTAAINASVDRVEAYYYSDPQKPEQFDEALELALPQIFVDGGLKCYSVTLSGYFVNISDAEIVAASKKVAVAMVITARNGDNSLEFHSVAAATSEGKKELARRTLTHMITADGRGRGGQTRIMKDGSLRPGLNKQERNWRPTAVTDVAEEDEGLRDETLSADGLDQYGKRHYGAEKVANVVDQYLTANQAVFEVEDMQVLERRFQALMQRNCHEDKSAAVFVMEMTVEDEHQVILM
jgi:hypothetical protein